MKPGRQTDCGGRNDDVNNEREETIDVHTDT
jgi:hypothetical protein